MQQVQEQSEGIKNQEENINLPCRKSINDEIFKKRKHHLKRLQILSTYKDAADHVWDEVEGSRSPAYMDGCMMSTAVEMSLLECVCVYTCVWMFGQKHLSGMNIHVHVCI